MTAYLATTLPEGPDWLYEIKWDGVRALCFVENGKLRLISRNGNSFDRQYPELGVLPSHVRAATAILDGEIAVLDDLGRSSFALIQPRIHQTDPAAIARLAKKTPATLFLFDLLYLDGYDLRAVPLRERKELLRRVLEPCGRVRYSEHFEAGGAEMLEAARKANLEGIMAKQAGSKYESRRSRAWLKVKVTGRQEFVICGFTEGERAYFSSLILGVYDEDRLRYVGNVGTGFHERNLPMIRSRIEPLITDQCPFEKRPQLARRPHWVKPEIVCEVKFSEWTRDGKLRAPVFLGLRTDKAATQSVRERPAEGGRIPLAGAEAVVTIDTRSIKFTNLNKVWFPKDKLTKRDILRYYEAVAEWILPHLKDRPLSLKRYPNGIHQDFFFQKDIPETYPGWLRTEPIHSEHRGEPIRYMIANDRATLLYLTNLGCIDHNPWMSRLGSLENPDFILIDLDPQECPFDRIVEAAVLVKRKLDGIGLRGYPKTTGGDGMHVYIPVEPRYSYDQLRGFAEALSQAVVSEEPDLFTTPRSVAKRRRGRVYFDAMQIGFSKTISAPYVVRPRDGAPVSTPLDWSEVKKGLTPEQFHAGNAVERFRRVGDLFRDVLAKPQRLESHSTPNPGTIRSRRKFK